MSGTLTERNPVWNLAPEWPYSKDCFGRLPAPAILADHTGFCKMPLEMQLVGIILRTKIPVAFYFLDYVLCSYIFLSG